MQDLASFHRRLQGEKESTKSERGLAGRVIGVNSELSSRIILHPHSFVLCRIVRTDVCTERRQGVLVGARVLYV
jgi:hypothetical protein